ncbi:MAG: hypothetical protein ACM335_00060, partial [Deltaproteobacteria bacterium]
MPSEEETGLFRKIPSVDRLLNSPFLSGVLPKYPRSLVLRAIHQVLDGIRNAIKSDREPEEPLDLERICQMVIRKL